MNPYQMMADAKASGAYVSPYDTAPRNESGNLYDPYGSMTPQQQHDITGESRVVKGGFPSYFDESGQQYTKSSGNGYGGNYWSDPPTGENNMAYNDQQAGYPPTGAGTGMQNDGGGYNQNYMQNYENMLGGGGNMAGYPPQQNGTASPWNAGQIPQPQPADYQSVQNFSDAAYNNARRYLDPQQEQDQRRLSQSYQNMGIDPMSDMGGQMSDQMSMQHGDQDIAAAFAGMGFGQGIQNQLYNQNIAGGNLQLGRQQQDFNEMMGYDQIDYRNANFNENNMRWDQNLAMQMAGFGMPDTGTLGQGGVTGTGSSVTPWSTYVGRTRDVVGA